MIDNAHALDVLFGDGNALWRTETRHESMLLMRALYKADAGAREKISAFILAGPPLQLLRGEGDDGEWHIFEMLAFLESEQLSLPPEGQQKLAEIRERHPEWQPKKYPGMSFWIESGRVDKTVTIDEIKSVAPGEIPERIITTQETGESRRDLCEAVGVAIAHDPEWGWLVMDALEVNLENLPLDAINPILWGIRATLTDNTNKMDKAGVVALLNKFGSMVEKKPSPTMWSSLPSLLQNLVGKFALPIESWNELAIRLASVFEAFDYERNEEEMPIEWRHRAINHPYGDTAELYLTLAQQQVKVLSEAGKALALEPHAESFFYHMLANYNVGSRYGLCLLAPWLSWMEAVSPKFSESLYPVFEWNSDGERPLVVWSGYLWSNTLSRGLVKDFDTTYIPAGKRHHEFASQERRGLASHVSAVFWFHPDRIALLCQFAIVVDSELRVELLHGWKSHLENAQEESAKKFLDTIMFPYWDWCAWQDFFSGDNGDKERFAFWELVPRSFASFPEACRRAVQRRPSKIAHLGLFVHDAVNESTLRYPNELTELLIAVLEFDPYPHWQEKDWRRSWQALKDTGAKRLSHLQNTLAKKGISVEVN
jgi:hypothetical protein